MVLLTFYWDAWAIFENNEVFRIIQREDYEADTWQDCCDECLKSLPWDDNDLVKGFENNVIETNRQLREICLYKNGEEIEASQEIYLYYSKNFEKLEKRKE